MKILGYEVMKRGTVDDLRKQFTDIKKAFKSYQKLRPDADIHNTSTAQQDGARIPLYYTNQYRLYHIARASDIILTVIGALRDGIFRRGTEIEEAVENPDKNQKDIIEQIEKRANNNDQELTDILEEIEDDINLLNNAYIIAINKYFFGKDGEILHELTENKEFIRGHPLKMSIISDNAGRKGYNDEGKKVFVSPSDRSKVIFEHQAREQGFKDVKTGKQLIPAHYRAEVEEGKYIYYFDGEVLHIKKESALIYGYPKMMAIWMKIETLLAQDRFLMLNYQKGRAPRGFLAFNTTNYDSLKKAWEQLKEETRKDPHSISPLLMETKEAKGGVQWIDLMKPLADMQFTESRNEMRRQIGALYGVMPLFTGDLAGAGGLNNEGLQMSVSNRAMEKGQKIYNNKVFPWILKQLRITDYTLKLSEPEERDETEDVRRMGMKIDNAVKMSQMGFTVTFNPEEAVFEFSETATKPSESFFPEKMPTSNMQQQAGEPTKGFIDLENHVNQINMKNMISKIFNNIQQDMIEEGLEIKKEASKEIISILSTDLFSRTFDNISKKKSDQIKKFILEGVLEKTTIKALVEKINKLGVDKIQAERIIRTEQSVLQNKVREFNFKNAVGSKNFKYKWIGPDDDRTSEVSKKLKRITKKGLPLGKLKSLVRKTAREFGFKPTRDWETHPNMRHTFTRVV